MAMIMAASETGLLKGCRLRLGRGEEKTMRYSSSLPFIALLLVFGGCSAEVKSGAAPVATQSGIEQPAMTNPTEVKEQPIRLLYIDSNLRWEYRYLKNALLRADPLFQVQTLLTDAGKGFESEHSSGWHPLAELPKTLDDLRAWDVVMIGDVPRERFGITRDERAAFEHALVSYVKDGGGVAFLCGPLAMPLGYRGGAIDEKLFPVNLRPKSKFSPRTEGIRVSLCIEEDELHPILWLADSRKESIMAWRETGEIGQWLATGDLREGATALLNHPGDSAHKGASALLSVSEHGTGRTLLIATDETWRWRKNHGKKYHDRFWRNAVWFLAGRTRH